MVYHDADYRQLDRERALLRYSVALDEGDFVVVSAILAEAESDAILEQMILDFTAFLSAQVMNAESGEPPSASFMEGPSAALVAGHSRLSARHSDASASPSAPMVGMSAAADSLVIPDHPAWHADRSYSPDVAHALSAAYRSLRAKSDQLSAYMAAYVRLLPHIKKPMARRQRIRMCYVLAMISAAFDMYEDALSYIDDALGLIVGSAPSPGLDDLFYLRGAICRACLLFEQAVASYTVCRGLRNSEGSVNGRNTATDLSLLAQLAGLQFFRGYYAAAEQLLDEGMSVVRSGSIPPQEIAALEWMQAHLLRWRGQPETALRHAVSAAHVYAESGASASSDRVQSTVAEIALDLVGVFPDSIDRNAFVALAKPHIRLAVDIAREAHDEIGMAMARLTQVRFSRLTRLPENRIAIIEDVVRLARHVEDKALLAQALTSLGDEMVAQDQPRSGLNLYREVLEVLDGSEVPALAVWARRSLHRLELQSDLQTS